MSEPKVLTRVTWSSFWSQYLFSFGNLVGMEDAHGTHTTHTTHTLIHAISWLPCTLGLGTLWVEFGSEPQASWLGQPQQLQPDQFPTPPSPPYNFTSHHQGIQTPPPAPPHPQPPHPVAIATTFSDHPFCLSSPPFTTVVSAVGRRSSPVPWDADVGLATVPGSM